MSLRIVLVLFVHVVRALSPDKVIGYLGDNITLPSRADPSWELDTIEWSILSNNTWIATHRNGKTNTEHFRLHKGRLSLNKETGDLTIHHLKREDEMEYTVDLFSTEKKATVNKVQLIIYQHLQQPTIKTLFSLHWEGGCWTGLQCSSQDEGVDFSWNVKPPTVEAFMSKAAGNSGVIFTFHNNTEIHEFTCTASRNKEKVSRAVSQRCERHRKRWGMYLAVFLTLAVVIVIVIVRTVFCVQRKWSSNDHSTENVNNIRQ